MKLELGYIQINDIKFSDENAIKDSTLYVNKDALKAYIFSDDDVKTWVKDLEFEIAKPGESIRITPVKDVIEPRVKVSGSGEEFPGVIGPVDMVGEGRTHVLKGMSVITVGSIVGFQEGLIDMTGPGSCYTPFSKLQNLLVVLYPNDDYLNNKHEYEHAARIAGLRAAAYVGEIGKEIEPDSIEVFETYGIIEGKEKFPDLPRVGYLHMLQSQGLLHDTYVYGVDAKKILPTLLDPTETMDGAILSGNCVSACDKNTTYHHQNNPIVYDLFQKHGKSINYVCNIITNENVYLDDKRRSSNYASKLCKMLDLDGVIVSEEGFGNPDTDLIMNATKLENKGIKTVLVTDEYAGQDGKSQSLADANPLANAVVTAGNANEVIVLPKLDKVIGNVEYIDKIAGGHAGSLREDGSIEVEIQVITGATNEMGYSTLSAK